MPRAGVTGQTHRPGPVYTWLNKTWLLVVQLMLVCPDLMSWHLQSISHMQLVPGEWHELPAIKLSDGLVVSSRASTQVRLQLPEGLLFRPETQ